MALSPRQQAIIAKKKKKAASQQGGGAQDSSGRKTSVQWDGSHAGFFHVEVYSKKAAQSPKAKNSTARTIHAVLSEVARQEEFSRHVDGQKTAVHPPELVFQNLDNFSGDSAADFAQSLEKYIDRRLDEGVKEFRRKGRTIRTSVDPTQSALVAGVISLPESCAGRYDEWLSRSLQFLRRQYPDGQLKGAIVHRDEQHPHLHFYAVSNRQDVDAKLLHQAHAAQKQARQRGQRPSIAYRQEMKRVQDDFYKAVSAPLGMKRRADIPYQRMKRGEYFAAKRQRELSEKQETEYLFDIAAGEREREALDRENLALRGEVASRSRLAVFGPSEKALEQSRQAAHEAGFQRARQKSAVRVRELQEAHAEEMAVVEARHKTDLRAVAERFRADIEAMREQAKQAHEQTERVREQLKQVQQQNEELRGGMSHKSAVVLAQAGRRMWAFFGELGPQSIQAQTVFVKGPQGGEGLLRWGYRLGRAMMNLAYQKYQKLKQEQERKQEQEPLPRPQPLEPGIVEPVRPASPSRPTRPSHGSSGPSM